MPSAFELTRGIECPLSTGFSPLTPLFSNTHARSFWDPTRVQSNNGDIQVSGLFPRMPVFCSSFVYSYWAIIRPKKIGRSIQISDMTRLKIHCGNPGAEVLLIPGDDDKKRHLRNLVARANAEDTEERHCLRPPNEIAPTLKDRCSVRRENPVHQPRLLPVPPFPISQVSSKNASFTP